MKLIEILKKNRELEGKLKGGEYSIGILSNITLNQIKPILEYSLRSESINAKVILGNYDSIVQDSEKFKKLDAVFIFWEVANIIGNINSQFYSISEKEMDALEKNIKQQIGLVLNILENTSLVLFNGFTSAAIEVSAVNTSPWSSLSRRLNLFLESTLMGSKIFVDIEKIILDIGTGDSYDFRQYHNTKALYSIDFLVQYCHAIKPIVFSSNGKVRKVLVLDCDNTLWGGVVGELGSSGICVDEGTTDGRVFFDIQSIILGLKNDGVLLAICSKNNSEDVEDAFLKRDMPLNISDFILKKINWDSKAKNMQALAEELNLGLDSFVFLDDSEFETNLVKKEFPQIKVIVVPKQLSEYVGVVKKLKDVFYYISQTKEDLNKTRLYQDEIKRKGVLKEIGSIDSYLRSLRLKIRVMWGEDVNIIRAA
jgi:HAD superfamily phosphatase (TIGR01681 family)